MHSWTVPPWLLPPAAHWKTRIFRRKKTACTVPPRHGTDGFAAFWERLSDPEPVCAGRQDVAFLEHTVKVADVFVAHGVDNVIHVSVGVFQQQGGLIETVEKAAQVYMLTAHLPRINTMKKEELAEYFGVAYRKDFLV